MELKEMCIIIHPYTCPECGNDMLFFTKAHNNTIIDYKNLIDSYGCGDELLNHLYDKNVEYLKCVICKKIYTIDWTRNYARPLIDKNVIKYFGLKE